MTPDNDKGDMTIFREIAEGKRPLNTTGYCGVCGKKILHPCAYGWLCTEHRPRRQNVGCEGCPNEFVCVNRVAHGLWVVCEMPSKRDIDTAIQRGFRIDNLKRPILTDVHI